MRRAVQETRQLLQEAGHMVGLRLAFKRKYYHNLMYNTFIYIAFILFGLYILSSYVDMYVFIYVQTYVNRFIITNHSYSQIRHGIKKTHS